MKGFINFINPFVGYIILPPFFTVQSVVPQNFLRFENKKYNYRISDPVQIVELFALCLTVCIDHECNILWNRELTCLTRYHLIQRARMMTNRMLSKICYDYIM